MLLFTEDTFNVSSASELSSEYIVIENGVFKSRNSTILSITIDEAPEVIGTVGVFDLYLPVIFVLDP